MGHPPLYVTFSVCPSIRMSRTIFQEPYIMWSLFLVDNALYLRNSVAYELDFWYIYVKWCYLQVFFRFFKILILKVFRGVKGQKMVQNDKKFCASHVISQEPYIIWLSFMLHMCKMIISPGVFFIFSKFWFFGLLWGWKDKRWSKMTKKSVCCTQYLRNHTSYDSHLWYTCVKW